MKTKHSFFLVLVTFLAIGVLVVSASAATTSPPKCSLMGTWSGWADHDWSSDRSPSLAWIAVQSPGSNNTTGGIVMTWVPSARYLFSGYGATLGQGIWKWDGTQYTYTWYAYLIDQSVDSPTLGLTVASVRVFGAVSFPTDCNHAALTYNFDMFNGMVSPDQMNYDNPAWGGTLTGIGGETRAPLVVPAP